MKISQMKYFYEVCKHQSVSRAAQELSISQPAVSMAIRALEAELKCSLFLRSLNRLTLTTEGQSFLEGVSEVLELVDKLPQRVQNSAEVDAPIRIGLPPVSSGYYLLALSKVVEEFSANGRKRKPVLVEYNSAADMVDALSRGDLDFAISTTDQSRSGAMKREIIYRSPLMLFVGERHRFADVGTTSIRDLEYEPLIQAFHSGSAVDCAIKEMFSALGAEPNYQHFFMHERAVRELLISGAAALIARPEMVSSASGIRSLKIQEGVQIPVHILWQADRLISSEEADLVDLIKQANWNFIHLGRAGVEVAVEV